MTGGEIVVVGKAAQALGKKALVADEKTREALLRAAEDTPEMRAAARSLAARTAVQERIKLLLYWPFARMIGVSQTYFEDTFPQEMAAKITGIPEKNLVTPAVSVAVPALQGLSYTFEEPALRDMFLSLLAMASDNRRADQAHPAFAEIIKQLSPKEATLLDVYLGAGHQAPAVRLLDFVDRPNNVYKVLMSHMLGLARQNGEAVEVVEEPQLPTWVDNWVRLGLVNVTYTEHASDEKMYEWVKARPEYSRLTENPEITELDFQKGLLRASAFGEQFHRAVH